MEVSKDKVVPSNLPLQESERDYECKSRVINDPDCDHNYQWIYTDAEGVENARCTNCPMGIRWKKEDAQLKEGKIIQKELQNV